MYNNNSTTAEIQTFNVVERLKFLHVFRIMGFMVKGLDLEYAAEHKTICFMNKEASMFKRNVKAQNQKENLSLLSLGFILTIYSFLNYILNVK